jgi:hypothetical protein
VSGALSRCLRKGHLNCERPPGESTTLYSTPRPAAEVVVKGEEEEEPQAQSTAIKEEDEDEEAQAPTAIKDEDEDEEASPRKKAKATAKQRGHGRAGGLVRGAHGCPRQD